MRTSILRIEILCPKYQTFRSYRVCKYSGGVHISVNAKSSANLIDLNGFLDIEHISVSIELDKFKLFVTCSNIQSKKVKDSDFILILCGFRWLSMPDSEL